MAPRKPRASKAKSKRPARTPRAGTKAKRSRKTAKSGATPAAKAKTKPRRPAKAAKPAPVPAAAKTSLKSPPGLRRGPRGPRGRRPVLPLPRPAIGRPGKSRGANPYETDLDRNPANFQPLTPLSFLQRAANAYPDAIAIVHGKSRVTYAEFYARSRRLASALAREGIGKGDTVSVLLPNTPPMLEAHHGVPMTGGVLNAINTRLDAASIAFMLDHSDAKIKIGRAHV